MISFKNKHSIGAGCLALSAALALTLTSCTDWDDHYDANTSILDTQNATLWENIERNQDLSQFAALLKKTEFDEVLGASQTYTVWAPVNGSFDYDALSAAANDKVLKEFVQNHVARNNYTVSGSVDERVFMLNEKMMHFDGNGSYTIQGIGLDKVNLASSNGVIHTVKQRIPFLANIYESLNSDEFAIDSISDFFHSFDERVLNEQRSVPGPIVDGEETYLDSIFDEDNDLYTRYRAFVNREDSNYTMVVPTNEAWAKAKAAITKLYHYVPSFEYVENTVGANPKKVNTIKLKDTAYLTDSMSNLVLTRGLFFNNNLYDNKRLNNLQEGTRLICDSLYSTTGMKIFSEDAAALFENAHRVDKSNGAIWVTDSLQMKPWTEWNPEIRLECEMSSKLSGYNYVAGEPNSIYVSEGARNSAVAGKLSNLRFMEAQASASNTNPELDYYLPDVRSTEYSVYIVFVPGNINNENYDPKPNYVRVTMGYTDANGKSKEERFTNPVDGSQYFTNDSSKIDTVYIGDFTFPIAFVGTGSGSQEYCPYLRIQSNVTTRLRDLYDRTLRIDCIIMRPKELDDYRKAFPGYKYDEGLY